MDGDDAKDLEGEPRNIWETLAGVRISSHYHARKPGLRIDIVGRAQNDITAFSSVNLTTTNTFYTNGSFAGYLRSTRRPDNTATCYLYDTNATQKTIILLEGQPDPSSDTNIVDGTKTVTAIGLAGQTVSKTVYAIPQNIIISQETYSDFDEIFRPGRVTYLDGTYALTTYNCCGIDSFTDRDGTRTDYGYDDLKRLSSEIRNGITTFYTYDGAGHRLTTIRQGTDSSQIVLDRSGYDLAGRLIAQTNALGGVTTYFETTTNNQNVTTTIFPDLGVQTNTYARDGSLTEVSGSAAHPTRHGYGVISSPDGINKTFTLDVHLDSSLGTNEWVQTIVNPLGQTVQRVFAAASSPPSEQLIYTLRGQLTNQVDADGNITIYRYNAKAERQYVALSTNRAYSINFAGSDRITFTTNDVIADNGTNVLRTRNFVWSTNGVGTSNLVSTVETSVDGLQTWNTTWNNGLAITTHNQTFIDEIHGLRVVTNTAPDSSYAVSTNQYGRLISTTRFDSANNVISSTYYGYDPHGRQNQATDLRNGTTTYYFNDADQISGVITPVPAAGQNSQTTSNFFDYVGRTIAVKLPDNTYVTNQYDVTGSLTNTYGSRTYPVGYTYDVQGRMKTMTTFGAAGAATTTWNYDVYRGWVTNKTYDGGTPGPTYTYTAAGRLASRLWARGTNTVYSYDSLGSLTNVAYNDGTVGCTYNYDRRGRRTVIKEGSTVLSSALYDDAGDLLSETYSSGPLSGLTVSNIYDSMLRRTTNGLWNGSVWLTQTRYNYDSASRLLSVSDGTNSATYAYVANSPLVSQVSFTNSGIQRMVTTKQYDLLNRLTNISSSSSTFSFSSSAYKYNDANQRTNRTDLDGSYWVYTYDVLGQVTSGKKFWPDGAPVAGQQFEYNFDNIGNRTLARSGGDQFGANLRSANYTNNSLNQITSRDVPGYFNSIGSANSNATVTLWRDDGEYATNYRHGDYFRAELPVNNSTGALWLTLTNLAVLQTGTNHDIIASVTGNAFVPKAPENFTYDSDGNLTSDGRWTNRWDAENRLVSIESLTNGPAGSKLRLTFSYDHQGRRVAKLVESCSGSVWTVTVSNKFAYDGWNLIAELNGTNNALIHSFMWGLDLSGSPQGAGGVGGLLELNDSVLGVHFVSFGGNGNAVALVTTTDGTQSAAYEYGPFGEVLRMSGPAAKANQYRFSTKYQDDETGLIMYPRRPYSPTLGRFPTRDPIEENGGVNLYSLVANNPVNDNDPMGLCNIKIRCNPVVEFGFLTVGWHCGVIGPDGQTYELGGVGVAGSSGGAPVIYPNPRYPDTPPDHFKDYPVSCNGCCSSVLGCIKKFTADAQLNPPTYYALWQNSNTYVHNMLNTCGCSVDPIPLCYTVLRSPKEGGPYKVCTTTTTPPHAVAW